MTGVARCYPTATSERGRGWVGYLPLGFIARSEASEHAFARRVIPQQDPLHIPPHFGAHFTRNPSGGCFDCAYSFAQHDIFLHVRTKTCFKIAVARPVPLTTVSQGQKAGCFDSLPCLFCNEILHTYALFAYIMAKIRVDLNTAATPYLPVLPVPFVPPPTPCPGYNGNSK